MLLLASATFCFSQATDSPPAYDAVLAARVGADDYGMKKYVIAFLKSGKTKIEDEAKRNELQKAHLKNIQRLAAEGKLVVAGPFLDKQPIRGIYIFNVSSIEEAKQLTETDPSIQAGDGGYALGDLNGDGAVDGSDFLALDPNIQGGVGAAIP